MSKPIVLAALLLTAAACNKDKMPPWADTTRVAENYLYRVDMRDSTGRDSTVIELTAENGELSSMKYYLYTYNNFVKNKSGRVTSVSYSSAYWGTSGTIEFEYSDKGVLLNRRGPESVSTDFDHDAQGRIVASRPSGSIGYRYHYNGNNPNPDYVEYFSPHDKGPMLLTTQTFEYDQHENPFNTLPAIIYYITYLHFNPTFGMSNITTNALGSTKQNYTDTYDNNGRLVKKVTDRGDVYSYYYK